MTALNSGSSGFFVSAACVTRNASSRSELASSVKDKPNRAPASSAFRASAFRYSCSASGRYFR